jgi:hypothetical protein
MTNFRFQNARYNIYIFLYQNFKELLDMQGCYQYIIFCALSMSFKSLKGDVTNEYVRENAIYSWPWRRKKRIMGNTFQHI